MIRSFNLDPIPLKIAGGRAVSDTLAVMTDVAIIGDRDGVIYRVLANEIKDHMALPMSLMLLVVMGATSLSIASPSPCAAKRRPRRETRSARPCHAPARRAPRDRGIRQGG